MSNNVIVRKVSVTDAWQKLSATSLRFTGNISARTDNDGDVLFRTTIETSVEVEWEAGEWHSFESVDLATIEVKNGSGSSNVITVAGRGA